MSDFLLSIRCEKMVYEMYTKKVPSASFMQIGAAADTLRQQASIRCHSYFSHSLSDLGKTQCCKRSEYMPFSIDDFREDRRQLKLHLRAYRETTWYYGSKERSGKEYRRHGPHHSQRRCIDILCREFLAQQWHLLSSSSRILRLQAFLTGG